MLSSGLLRNRFDENVVRSASRTWRLQGVLLPVATGVYTETWICLKGLTRSVKGDKWNRVLAGQFSLK